MKIAQVISTFFPQPGGMGQVALAECNELARRGHTVEVFTLRYPGKKTVLPFKVNRLFGLPRFGDGGFTPQLLWRLRKFDVVHLHYPFYGGAEWVLLGRILFGRKFLITYHMDAVPTGSKKFLAKIYDRLFASVIISGAEKVLSVDFGGRQRFKFSKNIVNKIFDLPNPIDDEFFMPRERNVSVLPNQCHNCKTILFVGNLLSVKRLDLIFKALQFPELSKACLLVVGGGYDGPRLVRLAHELGLSERINFLGTIKDRKILADFYSAVDVVVVPSAYESFSLVAAEALVVGTPLVVSSESGIARQVMDKKCGFVFKSEDAISLAQKLSVALSLGEIEREILAERSNLLVTEFSLHKHMEKLLGFYNETKTKKYD